MMQNPKILALLKEEAKNIDQKWRKGLVLNESLLNISKIRELSSNDRACNNDTVDNIGGAHSWL